MTREQVRGNKVIEDYEVIVGNWRGGNNGMK
jgi:hypothetical protein